MGFLATRVVQLVPQKVNSFADDGVLQDLARNLNLLFRDQESHDF
jgi:hypothetical protein